jgi:hypothetical protein
MVRESGERQGQAVVWRRSGYVHRVAVPSPLTTIWGLWEALQRTGGPKGEERRFAMLEDLQFLRLEQRLVPGDMVEVELKGRRRRWRVWHQFGQGQLPWSYCLDEEHRLLLAWSAMRAYLWEPTLALPEVIL